MNKINRDLQEYRYAIEHYKKILKTDELIKQGKMKTDGRPKLTDNDITKIHKKIDGLVEKRDELLKIEKDYTEINKGSAEQ